ncbi:hypothetical protein BCR33DRAFT_723260 [Rhizoclosmatium globosum]|uniref:Uncharacterized protein n=1 Tax=Rhizoclosmatium globosum TaxID=329046 RepID=A0A1Y2BEM2_9FUNG|nr:hypothetical protein BCR33DRAFT_723260 [Rhizoclosmatium globosum]|eukprot:ORY33289.1 hypothetical protein BCR33DRAFT_723260 [Rhizoclosmatium globosum]
MSAILVFALNLAHLGVSAPITFQAVSPLPLGLSGTQCVQELDCYAKFTCWHYKIGDSQRIISGICRPIAMYSEYCGGDSQVDPAANDLPNFAVSTKVETSPVCHMGLKCTAVKGTRYDNTPYVGNCL